MSARRQDHVQAENRYADIREIVFQATTRQFPGITARGITHSDTLTADSWKTASMNRSRPYVSDWNWSQEYGFYKNRPNRFELSLWRGGMLGALCFGQTSKAGTRVRMNLIESSPARPGPLGIAALPVLAYAAAIFADLIDATEIWILDPKPVLEEVYKREGFGPRSIYHGNRIGQRRLL